MILTISRALLGLASTIAWITASETLLAQAIDPNAAARRLADITTIAVAEYAEGVEDGRVVRVEELNEARLFLEQARRTTLQLGPEVGGRVAPILDQLLQGVNELRAEPQLRAQLTELRTALTLGLGISLDPMPEEPPSLVRGAAVYSEHCVLCHGESGGAGPQAAAFDPPPADLSHSEALSAVSVVDFFRKVNVGVAGTAMPGFADTLGLADRWAVALYAATLRLPSPAPGARDLLTERCPSCLLYVSDFAATAGASDDSLAALLAAGLGDGHGDPTAAAITAYGRVAGASEFLGSDRGLQAARVVARSKAVAHEAIAAVRGGNREVADARAVDAYLIFEEIETRVRALDASAAARVEAAFTQFRAALAVGTDTEQLESHREVEAALDGVLDRVTARPAGLVLFGQSVIIMLREGLEAILIIGALVAFLTKAGAEREKREIGWGVLGALVASGATAVALVTLLRGATAHREVLEGVTMVVAAAVLFWVSYWLVSKIEVRKWQEFMRAQLTRALNSRRALALAAVAFLAVYREGFETVLFYAALFTSAGAAPGKITAIGIGIVVAAVVLGFVYFLMQRFGVRLPLKPFFAITSALLYVMAFSFAGQGVFELQNAGVVSSTPLAWIPSLPVLGIFPTLQTVASQLVLAIAFAAGLLWVFWIEPRAMRLRAS